MAVCVALVWGGLRWPKLLTETGLSSDFPFQGAQGTAHTLHPFLEVLKLVIAAAVGLVVTGVHKRCRRDKPLTRSLEQAQVLLCVAGAMVMIIIGNSIARALSIAGAAAVIRFRTPVKDPKDTTILFLLLGLGMCCGLGAFAVAGLGTVFLSVFLLVLDQFGDSKRRALVVKVVAEGHEFPVSHVQSVFARHGVVFEAREFSQGDEATVKYHAQLDAGASLEDLSMQLMDGGASGIRSVVWERQKK